MNTFKASFANSLHVNFYIYIYMHHRQSNCVSVQHVDYYLCIVPWNSLMLECGECICMCIYCIPILSMNVLYENVSTVWLTLSDEPVLFCIYVYVRKCYILFICLDGLRVFLCFFLTCDFCLREDKLYISVGYYL